MRLVLRLVLKVLADPLVLVDQQVQGYRMVLEHLVVQYHLVVLELHYFRQVPLDPDSQELRLVLVDLLDLAILMVLFDLDYQLIL
jgi:hypothetical protein